MSASNGQPDSAAARIRPGRLSDRRCPRCGCSLLADDRGHYWCSFVGGRTEKGCSFGIREAVTAETLDATEADEAKARAIRSRTALVFLDFDGVLNRHGFDPTARSSTIERRCVESLNLLLIQGTAMIVVSSAWRYMVLNGAMTAGGFDYMLRTHGVVAERIRGFTRADTMIEVDGESVPMEGERGAQIADWRASNGHVGPYVVLDDEDYGIAAAGHPFVRTNGKKGLTFADACSALYKLQATIEETAHAR